MADGVADIGPIFEDVKAVRANDLPRLPEAIAAGFPCIDISMAGRGAGFGGVHSVLFKEVMRVVDR